MRGIVLVVAMVLAPVAAGADDACPARAADWSVIHGSLQAGRGCGRYVLATDAAAARFSSVEVFWNEEITAPYEASVTWRRLGPEGGRSMAMVVFGGVVLVKDGAIALYPWDEAAFAARGWEPVDGLRTHDEYVLSVTQTSSELVASIDGVEAARWTLTVAQPRGRIGLQAKGASGHRSRLALRAFAVRQLPAPAPAQ